MSEIQLIFIDTRFFLYFVHDSTFAIKLDSKLKNSIVSVTTVEIRLERHKKFLGYFSFLLSKHSSGDNFSKFGYVPGTRTSPFQIRSPSTLSLASLHKD